MATQTIDITQDPYTPIRLITECTFRGEDVLIVFPDRAIARTMFPTQLVTMGNPAGDGKLGNVYVRSAEMKSGLMSVNVRNVIFFDSENIDDRAKSMAQSKTAGHQYPNIWFLEL